ncbi:MAG: hypothetical protein ABSE16_07360 [Verrucomicrobiota bacterium]|jgi:hypothetical protein
MNFLKKHYEKILLSLVLLGLLGVLGYMVVFIPQEQESVRKYTETIIHPPLVALPGLDMAEESNVVNRLQTPYQLDFDTGNKLFNPIEWHMKPDRTMVPFTELGPKAAVVTNIEPLYFVLTLKSVETNEFGARFVISVDRQNTGHQETHYVSVGDHNSVFTVVTNGAPGNPDALILKLADSAEGETVTLSKGQPYKRADAYEADIKYDPENKSWPRCRVGRQLSFAGDVYTIVDINPHEVIISAQSNQRKWSLPYTP